MCRLGIFLFSSLRQVRSRVIGTENITFSYNGTDVDDFCFFFIFSFLLSYSLHRRAKSRFRYYTPHNIVSLVIQSCPRFDSQESLARGEEGLVVAGFQSHRKLSEQFAIVSRRLAHRCSRLSSAHETNSIGARGGGARPCDIIPSDKQWALCCPWYCISVRYSCISKSHVSLYFKREKKRKILVAQKLSERNDIRHHTLRKKIT